MIKPMDLAGLVALIAAFGLIVAGAFMASVIAGVFTLGGLLALVGTSLLYAAFAREARARANGQHAGASGSGTVRSVA
jgi:membrane-bound ClpP family serine protease